MKFWKVCRDCNGRGEVNPSSPHARTPARMSGEIVDHKTSVCKECQGCGQKWKMTRTYD